LRKADTIFLEELYRHDLYEKVSQAFAVFLPVKSVAVFGDARACDYVVASRAVQTVDFMTGQLGAASLRCSRYYLQPHHQRSARHLPRGLRYFRQAARDDRVGVKKPHHTGI